MVRRGATAGDCWPGALWPGAASVVLASLGLRPCLVTDRPVGNLKPSSRSVL